MFEGVVFILPELHFAYYPRRLELLVVLMAVQSSLSIQLLCGFMRLVGDISTVKQ